MHERTVTQFGLRFYERGGEVLEENCWDPDPRPSHDVLEKMPSIQELGPLRSNQRVILRLFDERDSLRTLPAQRNTFTSVKCVNIERELAMDKSQWQHSRWP